MSTESKLQFTHGDWVIKGEIDNGEELSIVVKDPATGLDYVLLRLIPPSSWESREETIANLRLIVAAPTLLKALGFCRSVIKANGPLELSERLAVRDADKAILFALKGVRP